MRTSKHLSDKVGALKKHLITTFFCFTLCLISFSALGQNGTGIESQSAGSSHSLALKEDGAVVAWGYNNNGQCDVPRGLRAISLGAGNYHSLALKEDGTVVAWGRNGNVQCDVPYGFKAISVSAGYDHSLALKEDGAVVAWGYNGNGQCDVPRGLRAVSLDAGSHHSLALKEDGTVVAWGRNGNGQCDVPYGLKAVSMSAGHAYSLALKEDGTVVAWGHNGDGQCDVPRGLKAVSVSAGYAHSLALKEDGTVVAWGYNNNGQCDVPRGLRAVSLDAGSYHSLALKEDGTVVAWGQNGNGQCDVPRGLRIKLDFSKTTQTSALPILSFIPGSIKLIGGRSIGGMDEKVIAFELSNTGDGDALALQAKVTLEGQTNGIDIAKTTDLPIIKVGKSQFCELPLTTDRTTEDGFVKIIVEVIEPRGFSPAPFSLEIPTKSFRFPNIEVVDFSSSHPRWSPLTPIKFDVLVQNTGRGDASDVKVELNLPQGVACLSDNQSILLGALPKGEMVTVQYDLLIPRNYNQSEVKPLIRLSEQYGDYGNSWSQSFAFENGQARNTIIISNDDDNSDEQGVVKGSLSPRAFEGGGVTFRKTNANHEVKTVAVIPKAGEDCTGEAVSGDDFALFAENQLLGTYNVVDRKFIDQTLGEIKFSMSGITKENAVLEAGCMIAAEGYVFVDYGCFEGRETVNVKLIHCESGENIWICQGIGVSARETMDEIVNKLGE